MLIIARKKDATIRIGEDIVITVVSVGDRWVKLGFNAPDDVEIRRGEIPDDVPTPRRIPHG